MTLIVAYGAGTNSTAMLIEMQKRNVIPDLILFADTGGGEAGNILVHYYVFPLVGWAWHAADYDC